MEYNKEILEVASQLLNEQAEIEELAETLKMRKEEYKRMLKDFKQFVEENKAHKPLDSFNGDKAEIDTPSILPPEETKGRKKKD